MPIVALRTASAGFSRNASLPDDGTHQLTRQSYSMLFELKSKAHSAEHGQLRGVHVDQQLDGRILHALAHRAVHLPPGESTLLSSPSQICH